MKRRKFVCSHKDIFFLLLYEILNSNQGSIYFRK
jgi:hypothetical protein